MRCGEKCFIVTIDKAGKLEEIKVNARSSIEARKIARQQKEEIKILKVKQN